MKHLRAINKKALRMDDYLSAMREDVIALQGQDRPAPNTHIPMGCSFVFSPGWEVDSAGGDGGTLSARGAGYL